MDRRQTEPTSNTYKGQKDSYKVRKIFGPIWSRVPGGWRELHNKEFHNLYCLPNIIKITKARRMRWPRHVVNVQKTECIQSFRKSLEGKRPLRTSHRWKDITINNEKNRTEESGVDASGLAQEPMMGSCEHRNEYLFCKKLGREQLSNC
jgi:hypothetical protein